MFDLKQTGAQQDPESTSGGMIKDKIRLSLRKKKKRPVETANPQEKEEPTENVLKEPDIVSPVIVKDEEQMEDEAVNRVEVISAKPSKFKNIFRKKEQNEEKIEISATSTEVKDDQVSDSITINTDNPESNSNEIVAPARKEKFSLFHKKEKLRKDVILSSSETLTDVDQSSGSTLDKSANPEKENKKFSLFHKKDKQQVEPTKLQDPSTPFNQSLECLTEIDEVRDETKKKERFNLFSKKKNKSDKETDPLIVEANSNDKNEHPEECLDDQKPSELMPKKDTKDTFRNLFQRNKIGKGHDTSKSIEAEKSESEELISGSIKESGETDDKIADEPEEKQKKDKSRNIFKSKKKITESSREKRSETDIQQDDILERDPSSDISESQPVTEVDSNHSEVHKSNKFNLFQKKKKSEVESTGPQEKEVTDEEPKATTKKKKSKSLFKSSSKSTNSEVQPSACTEELENPSSEIQTGKHYPDSNNPAVMPLLTAEKSKIPLLNTTDDQFSEKPANNLQEENPAVTLLQPNLEKIEDTIPETQQELNGSVQSLLSITSSEETGPFPTNEGTGMNKFRNMFKKKRVEESPESIVLIESDKESEVDTGTVEEQVVVNVEQVISKEKTKSRNIFKRNKNPPITTEETLNVSDNSENDDGWAITPITIVDIEKQGKPHKTWSERMRLPTTRPSKKMESVPKEQTRNEDNEMDLPDGQDPIFDDQQTGVKLLNETLEPSSTSNISIEEQMQLLCDLFGHQSDVIWDSYTPHQKEALKNKLKLVLDPGTNSKKRNIDKHVNDMTETIWNQCKYTDGVLNMGILFVALLNEKELDVRNAKSYSLRPVFRSVKCYNKDNKSTKGCCMIFIDETGRVYRNWQHFMAENTYDPSIIVAPAKGIFNTDVEGKVCLEFFTAPSSSVGAKILSITDKTATVTGLGASACFIGGMLTVALLPIAAPAIGIAMAGAGLVGAASAGYSMVRSTQKMKDLSEHEKSLNIKDAEARGHWLGLIGGLTGFVSGVASHGIDIIARSGTHVPAFFRGSIDAINAASIAVNGVGVIDGFSTVFLKWNEEKISTLEIMQLSASLFMFTHSMYNFETANSIIKKHNHDITVNEFRDKLGQNQRQHYHKMAGESLKVHGKGHHDVIRSLRAIPNQTDFQKMHKADNAITEGMATAAALLVAKFCKKYFVVDENDLTNTVLNAMTLLSDHAFDVFIDVVERFVECKGELVQKSLRGIISVEEVMSDVLTSVTSISESLGLDTSEFIETLTKTENFLSALIERIYDMYRDYERVAPNQTCAECKGVFTTTTTKSVKE